MKLLIVNGPNINMIGIREPKIYGKKDYNELVEYINCLCCEKNIEAEIYQSNHEGRIIDKIQAAYGVFDGIIINPAAYTHTSIAIADAISAVGIPTVEVHLSDIFLREKFRQTSYISAVVKKRYYGEGFASYGKAVDYFYKNLCNL